LPKTNSRNSGWSTTWARNTGSSRPGTYRSRQSTARNAPAGPAVVRRGPAVVGAVLVVVVIGVPRRRVGSSQRPPGEGDEDVLQAGGAHGHVGELGVVVAPRARPEP